MKGKTLKQIRTKRQKCEFIYTVLNNGVGPETEGDREAVLALDRGLSYSEVSEMFRKAKEVPELMKEEIRKVKDGKTSKIK